MKDSKKHILIFVKGFIMGISEVVPGVSGSTLALVMKVYFDFISLLYQISNFLKEIILFLIFKSNLKKVKKVFQKINFLFGFFLFFGMALAILTFSNVMNFLFLEYRAFVLAFFFGLVLASISVPWSQIKEKGLREVFWVVFTSIVFFLILSLNPLTMTEAPSPLYFFLGGSIAICAMVLPGISGSFIFLMLGLYEFIVNHISKLTKFEIASYEILNLIALFFGIVFGFSIFVRLLRHGLKNHSSIIYSILTGIIIASLRVLWPYYEVVLLGEILVLTFLAFVGFGVVFFLKKLG
jgi:putative membrane protein